MYRYYLTPSPWPSPVGRGKKRNGIRRRLRLEFLSAIAAFADRPIALIADHRDAFGGCGMIGWAIAFPFTLKIKYLLSGARKIVHEIAFGAAHHELVRIIFIITKSSHTTGQPIELLADRFDLFHRIGHNANVRESFPGPPRTLAAQASAKFVGIFEDIAFDHEKQYTPLFFL